MRLRIVGMDEGKLLVERDGEKVRMTQDEYDALVSPKAETAEVEPERKDIQEPKGRKGKVE